MRTRVVLVLMLISINLRSQNLVECGIDDNPILTLTESNFLTQYIDGKQLKNHDYTKNKAIFITGNSGRKFGTKSGLFNQIKEWDKNGEKIATSVIELNENEKEISGGYDIIITYWVKALSKNRKNKIIRSMGQNESIILQK